MLKLAGILSLILSAQASFANLVVYTDRPEHAVNAIVQKYTALTQDQVTVVAGSYDEIKARLEAEAAAPQADIVFVKDLVYLADLEQNNMLQPFTNPEISSAVAPFMQSPDKNWVGITFRARTIIYNSAKYAPGEIANYSDLTFTDAKWAGREPLLCLRRSKDAYNVALLGFFIETMGYDAAKTMVDGWMNMLAREPYSNDRSMIDDIVTGNCDVAVVNSYYLAGKLFENPALPVGIAFADQAGKGTHTNGAGMGIVTTSTQKENAEKFILAALDPEVQLFISGSHMDYPARLGLKPNTLVGNWPEFMKADVNWTKIGLNAELAKQLASEVGY